MDIIILAARVIVAGVFLLSGAGKLADRAGSQQAVRDFGVPNVLVPAIAMLLPVVELGIAIALIPNRTMMWGAWAALLLLGLFIVGIVLNMAQGRRPDCHCFGQLHSEPIGWPTIARNLLLMLLTLVILGGSSGLENLRDIDAGVQPTPALVWLVTLLMAGLIAMATTQLMLVMQEERTLYGRLDRLVASGAELSPAGRSDRGQRETDTMPVALEVGVRAPDFYLPSLAGSDVSLTEIRSSGKPVALVFIDPTCGPCGQLVRELPTWVDTHPGGPDLLVVSRGDEAANRVKTMGIATDRVVLQHDRELAFAYGILGTPSAVLVAPDGTIGSPVAGGIGAVRDLLAGELPPN
ncbi:MAG: redoxin domain-containing protein [Thermomicrobiales bacterium]|nr:redoxin domain-containing protein [Thermomicrobiales bacterium]